MFFRVLLMLGRFQVFNWCRCFNLGYFGLGNFGTLGNLGLTISGLGILAFAILDFGYFGLGCFGFLGILRLAISGLGVLGLGIL